MKTFTKFSLVRLLLVIFCFSVTTSYAQQHPIHHPANLVASKKTIFNAIALKSDEGDFNPCVQLLKDGLSDVYTTVDHVSFFTDSKHYFASDEFVNDYHNGKWNGGLSVVIDDVPIGLNVGASDVDIHTFQKRIRDATSVTVQLTTYSTISRSTINVDLANAFNTCIQNSQKFGLSIDATGEKNVAVTIKYRTLAAPDPHPTITSVDLVGVNDNERTTLLTHRLRPGTPLGDQLSFTVTRKPTEEFLIAVNTSNGLSIVKRLESTDDAVSNNNAPIGTIVASVLDFTTFSAVTKSNGTGQTWSIKSKWAPCDGRSVAGSMYQVKWAGALGPNVPDLRGVFLRGLNKFDLLESSTVNRAQANPDEPATRNTVQPDAVGPHSHTAHLNQDHIVVQEGPGMGYQSDKGVERNLVGNPSVTVDQSTGKETRPKNVSVFYYIRIN